MFGSAAAASAAAATTSTGSPQQSAIRRSDAQNVPSAGGANRNRTNSVSSNTSGSSGAISFPSSSPPNISRAICSGQQQQGIVDGATASGLDPVGGAGLPPAAPPPGLHPSALVGFSAAAAGHAPRAKQML